jgi:DnaJ-class molecular chaperone
MDSKKGLRGKMDRKTKKGFEPEKYGMMICPYCNGNGSLLNGSDGMDVCTKCGGFGLVKKDTNKEGMD